jgi:hypothetical protein
VHVEAD